jgi:diguanylate cyclase (GGDEF)-like protein
MPLHDSFKATGANVRLSKLPTVPSIEDLDFSMSQANKHPQAVVELPWKAATSPTTFVLRVTYSDGGDEGPSWTLHSGEAVDSAVLWSHESVDTFLIQSLIAAECDPERALSTFIDTAPKRETVTSPKSNQVPAQRPQSVRPNLPAPADLDRNILEALQRELRREGTGLLSEASFYWLVIQEFNRYQQTETPCSLLIIEMGLRLTDGAISLPPLRVLHEAAGRMQAASRALDSLCHYKDPKLALVLPHTDINEALQQALRLEQALLATPLGPGLDPSNVALSVGIASIPDTCNHPGILIAAAADALEQSKRTNSSIVLFPSG